MESTSKKEMLSLGLFVRIEAKPGKEDEVAAFLMEGLQLAGEEPTTPLWFALRARTDVVRRIDFGVISAYEFPEQLPHSRTGLRQPVLNANLHTP